MNETACWISTHSGTQINLLDPQPEQIHIEDIAHGLSQTCRFAGQCPLFYSVAQHSVLVADLLPEQWALHGLLHDASEAFMGDLHTGLKQLLPDYKRLENRVLAAVFRHFGLDDTELKPEPVEQADRQALFVEMKALNMRLPLEAPANLPDIRLEPWSAQQARQKFLERFAGLVR